MTTLTRLIPQLSSGKKYAVRVRAINGLNVKSAWSNTIVIKNDADGLGGGDPGSTPPSAVSGLEHFSGATIIYLTWNANTESNLRGYNIYASDQEGFTPGSANLVASIARTDLQAISQFYRVASGQLVQTEDYVGTTVYFHIRAFNTSGAESTSVQFTETIGSVSNNMIESMVIDKLLAGTLDVAMDLTVGGVIRTGSSGARVEMDGDGIRLYDNDGTTVNVDINVDGSAFFRGSVVANPFKTAETGERIEVETASASTLRFFSGDANEVDEAILYADLVLAGGGAGDRPAFGMFGGRFNASGIQPYVLIAGPDVDGLGRFIQMSDGQANSIAIDPTAGELGIRLSGATSVLGTLQIRDNFLYFSGDATANDNNYISFLEGSSPEGFDFAANGSVIGRIDSNAIVTAGEFFYYNGVGSNDYVQFDADFDGGSYRWFIDSSEVMRFQQNENIFEIGSQGFIPVSIGFGINGNDRLEFTSDTFNLFSFIADSSVGSSVLNAGNIIANGLLATQTGQGVYFESSTFSSIGTSRLYHGGSRFHFVDGGTEIAGFQAVSASETKVYIGDGTNDYWRMDESTSIMDWVIGNKSYMSIADSTGVLDMRRTDLFGSSTSLQNVKIDSASWQLQRETSTRRSKLDITTLENSDTLDLLRPVTYRPIGDEDKVLYGLIAEEVSEADRKLAVGPDDENYHDRGVMALLVHRVKELTERVKELESQAI